MSNSKNYTSVFLTSDWHVGDTNCIELDERPFRDLEHMEQTLVKRFNSVVPETGLTYLLGDMGRDFKQVLPKLNGRFIFIMGNHDHSGQYAMMDWGIEAVLYSASIKIGGHFISLSHCPLRGVFREDVTGMKGAREGEHWHGESRHHEFSIPNHKGLHCHGHIHSPNGGKSVQKTNQQFDVGVVGNKYFPVTTSQVSSWAYKATRGDYDQKEEAKSSKT